MSLLSAIPMRFFHESHYGRPSCPKCGEAMIAPETSILHLASVEAHPSHQQSSLADLNIKM